MLAQMREIFIIWVLWGLLAAPIPTVGSTSSEALVLELTARNFASEIQRERIVLARFYTLGCSDCQALTQPAWEQAAKALKGIVAVGAVDADSHKELAGEYRIQTLPAIKLLYVDKEGSIKAVDYREAWTAKGLVTFALETVRSMGLKRLLRKPLSPEFWSQSGSSSGSGSGPDGGFYAGTDVVTLTAETFQNKVLESKELWLVKMYAPWGGHCRHLKPRWTDAAAELAGKVKFGAVDCTVHESLCAEYNIRGFPTIKVFGNDKAAPEMYVGARDAESIVIFALAELAEQALAATGRLDPRGGPEARASGEERIVKQEL